MMSRFLILLLLCLAVGAGSSAEVFRAAKTNVYGTNTHAPASRATSASDTAVRLSDHDLLLTLLRQASEDDPDALYKLYFVYTRGFDSIAPDPHKALDLLRAGAEAGNSDAQNLLGYRMFKGDGMPRNVDQALIWLEQSAGSGNLQAASNLGYLLLHGEGIVHDSANAAFWLGRAVDGNIPAAQSMLGDLYLEGNGVEKNRVTADSLYRAAFRNGLTDAAYKLVRMHEDDCGTMSPPQLVKEALSYYTGGVPELAVPIFIEAAEAGDAQASALLGDAYTRASGVGYDHQKALDCYARAAATGFAPAMFFIGELLEIFPDALSALSEDVKILFEDKPETADYWMERAAASGVRDAAIANRLLFTPPD